MKPAILVSLIALCAPAAVHAAGGPFGAGVIVGEPSGLSFKLNLDQRHAIDFALDFSFVDDDFYVHADYVLHFPQWMRGVRGGIWRPYVGVGGKVKVRDDDGKHSRNDRLSLRIPIGVAWSPKQVPIDVFLEFVPGVRLLPETDPDFDAGLGARYFF
jgi:hypothetical protein